MERSESPTPEKLEELRQKGITPVSHLSIRLLIVAGVLVFLGFFGPGISTLIGDSFTKFSVDSEAVLGGEFLDKVAALFALILVLPVALAIVVGLLQTRFSLKFSFIDKSQIANVTLLESFGRRIQKALVLALFGPLIGLVTTIGVAYLIWPEILKLYVLDTASIAPAIKKLHHLIFFGGGVLAILISITVWLVARYRFMVVHRMTRAEVNNKEK
jgi:flagellar biosynthesis protein FlhB